jgi:tetratricopeptide (TPR) repeat protein
VLVGVAARAQVQSLFDWSDPVPLEMKGKAEPILAAEALAPRVDASRARRLPGRGAPLVGRDAELTAARAVIEQVVVALGGVLVISGEAGIGKTRLLETLREGSPSTVLWLEGACTSFGSSTPYAPLAQVLGSWQRAETEGRRPEDLLPSDYQDARAALALLAGKPGPDDEATFAELSPAGRQLATVEGLRSFFGAVAAASRVAVVVEDLHWCDPSSIQALEQLLPLAASEPLAFAFTTRPDPGTPAAAALGRAARAGDGVVRIELDALPPGSDRELVAALVGAETLPPALLEHLLEVGGGNPFFLGELVRSLIEKSTLVLSNGGWTVAADARPELPSTVDRVLLARIDRLPDEDRDVLTAASLLGRRFSSETLATLLERDPAEALERLADADLVRPEPPDHAFAHALVQETAYATILRKRRRELHARAAAAIEAQPGAEDRAAVLGRHHAGADNGEEALRWFLVAADRAEGVSALLEAIDDLDEALSVAGPGTDVSAEILLRRGRLRGRTGDHRGARTDLDRALREALDRGDRSLEMRCRDEIGFLVAGSADYRESVEHLERALAIADQLEDADGRVSALSRLTITWANRLQLDRAQRTGELALDAASAAGDELLRATALDALKPVALMLGRIDDVEHYGDELRPLYARRNDRWLQQFVDLETAFASIARCRFEEARGRLDRSLAANRELHDDGNEPLHLGTFSHYHRCRGDLDTAVEIGRRAFLLARERGHLEWTAFAASSLGGTLLQLGAREEAVDVLRTGVEAAERSGADLHALRCVGLLARALARTAPGDDGGRVLRSAEGKLQAVSVPVGEALLFGWDGSVGVAAGQLAGSEPKRAVETIEPVVEVCIARLWPEAVVDASLVRSGALAALDDREGALGAALVAEEWAERHALPLYAWRAAAAVATLHLDRREAERAAQRARAASGALLGTVTSDNVGKQLEDEIERVLTGGTAWA